MLVERLLLPLVRRLPRGGFPLVRHAARLLPGLRAVPVRPVSLEGLVLYADLTESVWYPLWKYGCYPHQKGEEIVLSKVLRSDMTVFDIGANIGYLAAFFALRCQKGRVIAFEPAKRAYVYLEKVARACPNLAVEAVAMADREGLARLREESNLDRTALSTCDGYEVRTTTVDAYCTRHGVWPEVLKVDVEGADHLVLAGARDALARSVRYVMFEALDSDALAKCLDALAQSAVRWLVRRIRHDGTTCECCTMACKCQNITNNYIAVREAG